MNQKRSPVGLTRRIISLDIIRTYLANDLSMFLSHVLNVHVDALIPRLLTIIHIYSKASREELFWLASLSEFQDSVVLKVPKQRQYKLCSRRQKWVPRLCRLHCRLIHLCVSGWSLQNVDYLTFSHQRELVYICVITFRRILLQLCRWQCRHAEINDMFRWTNYLLQSYF